MEERMENEKLTFFVVKLKGRVDRPNEVKKLGAGNGDGGAGLAKRRKERENKRTNQIPGILRDGATTLLFKEIEPPLQVF